VAMSAEARRLELDQLREGYPCLVSESGARLAWAGAICLEERKHKRGVLLVVSGDYKASFSLGWPKTSPQVRREWSDPQEATEDGACGVAILLVDALTEYHIVQRSWKSTGFDYWLGPKKKTTRLLQKTARLEVSGIRVGTANTISKRVKERATQTERSDHLNLPAFVVVVEFGTPVATVVKR
jgi:hypothetical protein